MWCQQRCLSLYVSVLYSSHSTYPSRVSFFCFIQCDTVRTVAIVDVSRRLPNRARLNGKEYCVRIVEGEHDAPWHHPSKPNSSVIWHILWVHDEMFIHYFVRLYLKPLLENISLSPPLESAYHIRKGSRSVTQSSSSMQVYCDLKSNPSIDTVNNRYLSLC